MSGKETTGFISRAERSAQTRWRTSLPILLVFCVGVVGSVWGFVTIRNAEEKNLSTRFEREAQGLIIAIDRSLEASLDVVWDIQGLYAASHIVERQEFRVFVQPFLARSSEIQALEWIPRVRNVERAQYKEVAQQDEFPQFQITEREVQGGMVRADQREEYFPVYYVEPYEGNEMALGFDLASNPVRLEALHRSRDTGDMAATARIALVQETTSQFGFLAFMPVYRKGAPVATIEQRRESLEGFALGVYRIGDIVENALAAFHPKESFVDVYLFDDSAPPGERFLYASSQGKAAEEPTPQQEARLRTGLHIERTLNVAERRWRLLCTPAAGWLEAQTTWQAWIIFFGGLLVTGLLMLYLAALLGGTARTEQLVRVRTAELSETNEQLRREVTERKRAEERLKKTHGDLMRSHKELETSQLQLIQAAKLESVGRLAAGVAHEVKNPLAIIQMAIRYLSKHSTANNTETAGVLKDMEEAIKRADVVVGGLLDFSAPGETLIKPEQLNSIVEQALSFTKHLLDKNRIALVESLGENLPFLELDKGKIGQVFVNLFTNAIHAMPGGGTLTVKAYAKKLTQLGGDVGNRKTDHFRIGETVVVAEIEDTGSGIPEDKLSKIFDPFFTTKATGEGAGLGLTVTQKIVELHSGILDIQNRKEGGTKATLMFKTERK
ncbi:MAG: CHASE domain-containing protein [Deltaproteobacteria bacterium]|nr:CHASE domain-containing protein [Deltaproteobacteria bacterium]